jgi:hypothetical protein
MEITYVMFGFDQQWAAFAASAVTASQARGIAESMELRGYHMAPSSATTNRDRKAQNRHIWRSIWGVSGH